MGRKVPEQKENAASNDFTVSVDLPTSNSNNCFRNTLQGFLESRFDIIAPQTCPGFTNHRVTVHLCLTASPDTVKGIWTEDSETPSCWHVSRPRHLWDEEDVKADLWLFWDRSDSMNPTSLRRVDTCASRNQSEETSLIFALKYADRVIFSPELCVSLEGLHHYTFINNYRKLLEGSWVKTFGRI